MKREGERAERARAALQDASARAGRSAGHVAIAITVALLGFLLAVQLRSQQSLADRLSVEREEDLGQILGELTSRQVELQEEIIALSVRLESAGDSAKQRRELLANAKRELAALQILLGLVPVKGQGIEMRIADPESTIGPEILLDAVQELRDAGAEAIEVAGIRVVANTAFGGKAGALTIGATVVEAPYVIKAIGASGTLAEGMRIPGGVADAVAARSGASVRITEHRSVSIHAVSPLPRFTVAQPRR